MSGTIISPSSASTSLTYFYERAIRVLLLLGISCYSVYRLELSHYLITSNEASSFTSLERYRYNGYVPALHPSPACRPHFQMALPNGQWTNGTKFTRLYFYHVRKAGVSQYYMLLVLNSSLLPLDALIFTWRNIIFPRRHILIIVRGQPWGGTLRKLRRIMDLNTKLKNTLWRKTRALMTRLHCMWPICENQSLGLSATSNVRNVIGVLFAVSLILISVVIFSLIFRWRQVGLQALDRGRVICTLGR